MAIQDSNSVSRFPLTLINHLLLLQWLFPKYSRAASLGESDYTLFSRWEYSYI